MADNTVLNAGAGGDTIRQVDKAGAKTQVILLDVGGLGAESFFSGAVTITSGTISLPAGASTSVLQTTGNNSLASIDGKIVAVNTGAVVIASGTITSITNPVAVTGTFFQATQPISATALPLPAGASTSGLQTTGNTSLSSIDGKIPVLGQALAAASVPVVLAAAQVATLTPLATVAITAAALPLPANAAQETGGNLAALVSVLGTTADAEVRTDVDGTIASRLLSMSVQLQELIDQQKNTNAFLFRLAFANRVSNGERILKKV